MEFDKCKIAEEAADYLAEGRDHWTQHHFVRVRDEWGTYTEYDEEDDALAFLKSHPNQEHPVCMLGSLVYACAKLDIDILSESAFTSQEWTDFVHEYNQYVNVTTGYRNVTDFNDDDGTEYENVVQIAKGFAKEVCQ